MILGITGSIGSGKTAAAKMFSKYHYSRIDADEIGHESLTSNKKIKDRIIKEFGNGLLDKNGNINRKKLGAIVFNDRNKLKKLNSIMHPLIIDETKNQIKKIQNECGADAKIIIDAPLLRETNLKNSVDKIIVVKASSKKITARNRKFSMKKLEKIFKTQMPLDKKLKKADFVIDNNGNFKNLEKQVKRISNYLCSLSYK